MRTLILIGFGLLPLWANVAFFGYALVTGKNELAFVSMWGLIVTLPACAATLAIAGASVAVHTQTDGSAVRKSFSSLAVVVAGSIVLLVVGLALWGQKKDTENALRSEARVVEAFVARDPSVLAAVAEPSGATVVSTHMSSEDVRPSSYYVEVRGNRMIYAIVGVSRTGSQRKLTLLCIKEQLPRGQDPCSV